MEGDEGRAEEVVSEPPNQRLELPERARGPEEEAAEAGVILLTQLEGALAQGVRSREGVASRRPVVLATEDRGDVVVGEQRGATLPRGVRADARPRHRVGWVRGLHTGTKTRSATPGTDGGRRRSRVAAAVRFRRKALLQPPIQRACRGGNTASPRGERFPVCNLGARPPRRVRRRGRRPKQNQGAVGEGEDYR